MALIKWTKLMIVLVVKLKWRRMDF
jgi:hypothetical protein